MILDNLIIKGREGEKQIGIQSGRIKTVQDKGIHIPAHETLLRFENAIAFPGLINSHDHLDFNLFPQLANRVYNNYTEWAADIHTTDSKKINAILKIPRQLRAEWGLYKNLLNGFTTVVNHGERIQVKDELISVFQDCYSLHSNAFEKNWKWKLNNPFKTGKPFVMHIGEGTDEATGKETDGVIRWNLFKKKIIAVHGIQMNRQQASSFAGLTWCPDSNYFLLGQTTAVNELKGSINIVFGTDSTLSADWNAWKHFRLAIDRSGITENELLAMLTTRPADLWKLDDRGELTENKLADIVIAKKKNDLFSLNPEDILLVLHRGHIRLYDESIASQVKGLPAHLFSTIQINESVKFVAGDVAGLMNRIRSFYPDVDFPLFT